jgi:hypothetical protein
MTGSEDAQRHHAYTCCISFLSFPNERHSSLDTDKALYNVENQAQASFYLCIIGNSLRYHPSNLDCLLKEVPGFKNILVGDAPPTLRYQKNNISDYAKARKMYKDRPSLAERDRTFSQCLMLELYSPYHQWNYLIAPLWIEMIHDRPKRSPIPPQDTMIRRCIDILTSVTSHEDSHLIYGYSAMESMTINDDDNLQIDESGGKKFDPIFMVGWLARVSLGFF